MKSESVEPNGAADLTDFAIRQIYGCLTLGASLQDAAESTRVPFSVIRDRRRTDPEFARGLRQAIRQGKIFHLNRISKATAWQASAWLLERRWRRQFGRSEPVDKPAVPPPEVFDWDRLTIEQQRRVIEILNLGFLTRAETIVTPETPAAGGGADQRSLPAPSSGTDRGGAMPEEPA